ncbi:hypothetical protein ACFGVS_03385 [Mucilaginibacter sp. AW1-7]|uniref:hypothetical protein n=1 Tax=Mucilaginibacter sp. AW1-7 TaxID=3349874 RepID=UPI003F73CC92
MTLYEFNALNEELQATVAMQGNFVDVRFEDNLRVALYSHQEFYAEVFYDGETNRIVRSRAFISAVPLAAYIQLN